jgi:hypothetical protein
VDAADKVVTVRLGARGLFLAEIQNVAENSGDDMVRK